MTLAHAISGFETLGLIMVDDGFECSFLFFLFLE